MRSFFTVLATSLVALSAQAHEHHAAVHAKLVARTAIKPSYVCGDNFVDCNNGFCCESSSDSTPTCATLKEVPLCKISETKYVAALPYDDSALAAAQTALSAVISSLNAPATTTTSSTPTPSAYASTTSSLTPSSTGYGHVYNATSGYAAATNAPYPTGGAGAGHANGTGVATGTYPSSTFTGAAGRVGMSVGSVVGVVGLVMGLVL